MPPDPNRPMPLPPPPDHVTFEWVRDRLLAQEWIFAKTMPRNPHWYTLKKKWADPQEFEWVVQFIRNYGYREYFYGQAYTMLNVEDHKYWTMGYDLQTTILINRKRLSRVHGRDLD